MPKWWWERWRRGGKRLRRDERRAHQKIVEAEPELINESERWRDEESPKAGEEVLKRMALGRAG